LLFIYGSFDEAVSISDYMALKGWMVIHYKLKDDVEGRVRIVIWDDFPAFTWRDWEKLWEPLVRIVSFPDRHSNRAPSRYKSEALQLEPTRFMKSC
jgi:hypothetical protein